MTFIGQEKPSLDDLAHHGVKGMKWGVRKDQQTSGGSSSIQKQLPNVKLGSGEAAPIIALGAVYLGLMTIAMASKVKDSGKITQIKNRNVVWKTDPSLAKKMSVDDLYKKVVKPINADFGAPGTKMNCRRCTFTYEMRRRGYDVKATTSKYATGQNTKGLHTATSNKLKSSSSSLWGHTTVPMRPNGTGAEKSSAIFKTLSKQPEGARGELGLAWTMGGGHSIAWEIVKGKPVLLDTQSSVVYKKPADFDKFAATTYHAAVTRLDNVPIDDSFIRKWTQNA